MKKKFLAVIAALATVIAATVATSACFWYFYQPEEPKSLQNL
ncbi:MAG: cyclic lactone autoinducer peptide [Clostridia bacterium]|nr:cyclic lactone autoinducer peptide [Clostridia bacterium]MBQ6804750.1 cyclic lactone autoinducer peptide [Clostridia bacterium]